MQKLWDGGSIIQRLDIKSQESVRNKTAQKALPSFVPAKPIEKEA